MKVAYSSGKIMVKYMPNVTHDISEKNVRESINGMTGRRVRQFSRKLNEIPDGGLNIVVNGEIGRSLALRRKLRDAIMVETHNNGKTAIVVALRHDKLLERAFFHDSEAREFEEFSMQQLKLLESMEIMRIMKGSIGKQIQIKKNERKENLAAAALIAFAVVAAVALSFLSGPRDTW